MWQWIGALVIGWLAWKTFRRWEVQKLREVEERNELQSWHGEDYRTEDCHGTKRIHFPSMLFEYTFDSFGSSETYRLFHVRRVSGGKWELMLTEESFEMELADDEPVWPEAKERREKLQNEGRFWEPLEDATLEVAYQRFVHAQGVQVWPFGERWREEEQKHLSRIRLAAAPATQPPRTPSRTSVAAADAGWRVLESAPAIAWADEKLALEKLIRRGAIDSARELAMKNGLMGTFEDLMCSRKG